MVSELAKVAAQEQALLDQSKDLLSTIAAMHVSSAPTECLTHTLNLMIMIFTTNI